MRHSTWEDDTVISIVEVYAVTGDYGNIGDGALVGIFIIEDEAKKAAVGRGSLDCGGNGRVTKRLAIKVLNDQTYYLIDKSVPFKIKEGIVTDKGKYNYEVLKGE